MEPGMTDRQQTTLIFLRTNEKPFAVHKKGMTLAGVISLLSSVFF